MKAEIVTGSQYCELSSSIRFYKFNSNYEFKFEFLIQFFQVQIWSNNRLFWSSRIWNIFNFKFFLFLTIQRKQQQKSNNNWKKQKWKMLYV